MAPRRRNHSRRSALSAFPAIPNRPGRYSRSTYRRPLIQQRQPYAIRYHRRQRIRQRRDRERIGRHGIDHAQGARLTPHWEGGRPGEFWWRLR
jgi:hypothetical protein